MLYERCVCIIEILIQSRQAMTTGGLASLLSVSSRTIRSDLDAIDRWLGGFSHESVVRISGVGTLLKDTSGQIQVYLREKGTEGYVISSAERIRSITGWLLSEGSSTSIAEMTEKLQISATTVSNDLWKMKVWMDRSCIHMASKPHMGITVRDTENNTRKGCIIVLREMLETGAHRQELIGMRLTQTESLLRRYQMTSFCSVLNAWRERTLFIVRGLQDSVHVTISGNRFYTMLLYLLTAFTRMDRGHPVSVKRQTSPHIEVPPGFDYNRIHSIIPDQTGLDASENEMFLIHAEWMSLREFDSSQEINVEHILIAKELIAEVKGSLEIEFKGEDDTILDLATRLNVMQYRLFLSISAEHNAALQEIEETFPDVCQVVGQKLCTILKKRLGTVSQKMCSQKAAYISMYVVACILKNPLEAAVEKDVIIVYDSTVTTSRILENRLKSIFSDVNIIKSISYHRFINTAQPLSYDLITSTLPLESTRCQYVTVSPLLKLEDIDKLMGMFMLRMQSVGFNKYINATINIVARSLRLRPEECIKLSIELARDTKEEVQGLDESHKPAMRNLLGESLVAVNVHARSCCDTIQLAGDLLKKRGYITQRHIDRMVRIRRKLGGYMVVDKGVALPHLLAPELSGPCTSVITLDKPVRFNHADNDSVDLIVMLLSNHSTAHIKVLEGLADLLGDAKKREAICLSTNAYELLDIIS